MRRRRENPSLLKIWNTSYAIGLGVVLALVISLYAYLDRAIEELVISTNAVHGETLGNKVGNEIEELQEIAFRISMDGRLVSYDTDPQENTRLLVRELKRYALMNPWIDSIAICLPEFDTVIFTEGRDSLSGYRELEQELKGIDPSSAWGSGDMPFIYPPSGEDGRPVPILRYLCRKDIRYPRGEDCILIQIDGSAVDAYLRQFGDITGNSISITTAGGETIWQFDQGRDKDRRIIEQTFSIDSLGWEIRLTSLKYRYFAKINAIRGLSLGVLTVIILAYFSLTRYFSRKNYDPVARLIKRLSSYESPAQGDEFDKINASLSTMDREMDRYRRTVREGYFVSLLRGEIQAGEKGLGELQELGIDTAEPGKTVLISFLQPPGDNRQVRMVRALAMRDRIDTEDRAFITAVISDVTWTLYSHTTESGDDLDNTVRTILDQFAVWKISAVVSRPLHRASELPLLAEECLTGTMMPDNDEYGSIIRMNCDEPPGESYFIPQSSEECIISGILLGKQEEVRKELTHLISENSRIRIAPGMNFVFLSSLLALVLKPLQSSRVTAPDIQEAMDEHVRLFLKESTISARTGILHAITADLCEFFTSRRTQRNHDLQAKLLDFIKTHALDSSICHTMIADAMGMNSKYLARFFLEHTGETISRRITSIRMKRARELLLEGKSVQDVSLSVGYSGSIPFIRVFKKHEGLSPGRYRQEKL